MSNIKRLIKEYKENILKYSDLIPKEVLTDEVKYFLKGYKEKYSTTYSSVTIPEFSIPYFERDDLYIKNHIFTDKTELEPKYEYRPELILKERYHNPELLIYDFLYLNEIFSRMDFSAEKVREFKLFDFQMLEQQKIVYRDGIDLDTKRFKPKAGTARKLNIDSDKEFIDLIKASEKTVEAKDIKIHKDLFSLIISKFHSVELDVLIENLSNQHIVDNLLNSVSYNDLLYILTKLDVLEKEVSE